MHSTASVANKHGTVPHKALTWSVIELVFTCISYSSVVFDQINVTSDVGAMTDALRDSLAAAVGQIASPVFKY